MDYTNLHYFTRNQTPPNGKRIVFISHKHSDDDGSLKKISEELLEYADCAIWYDYKLTGGCDYDDEIRSAIISADAMILLISPTVFQSDYIWNIEVPTAKENGIPIIPIIINNPDAPEEVEQRLDGSIQCLDYFSKDFHESFIRSIETFIINATEESCINQIFLKKLHESPYKLNLKEQLLMAKGYCRGIGTEKNRMLAENWLNIIASTNIELFKEECKPILIEALTELMTLYRPTGYSKYKSLSKYEETARRATDLGFGDASVYVADIYRKGKNGIKRDMQKAIEWYTRAANAGSTNAMIAIANIYKASAYGVKQDMNLVIQWYTRAANAGNANTMINLANIYKNGMGNIKKDPNNEIYWYKRAAEAGNTHAMIMLGKIYRDGNPEITKDAEEAVKWYTFAADAGNTNAMMSLGKIYRSGLLPIEKDAQKALEWYTLAAEAGNTLAMIAVGNIYKKGMGEVERDGQKAVEWFTQAAKAGNTNAIVMLGKLYNDGMLEVAPDLDKAIELFEKAAANNATGAENLLKNAKQLKADRELAEENSNEPESIEQPAEPQLSKETSDAIASSNNSGNMNIPAVSENNTPTSVSEPSSHKSHILLTILIILIILIIAAAAITIICPDLLNSLMQIEHEILIN